MTDDNDISPTDLLRLTQPAEPEAYDPIPLTKLDRRWIWGVAVGAIAIWAGIGWLVCR